MIFSFPGTLFPGRCVFKRKRTKTPKQTSYNHNFSSHYCPGAWMNPTQEEISLQSFSEPLWRALSPSMWWLMWLLQSNHAKGRQSTTSHPAKHPKSLPLQNESPHLHAGQFFGRAEAVDRVGSAGLELDEQQQKEAIEKWTFSVHGADLVGSREVQAVSSEMSLQVSSFLVVLCLFWSSSFILFGWSLLPRLSVGLSWAHSSPTAGMQLCQGKIPFISCH